MKTKQINSFLYVIILAIGLAFAQDTDEQITSSGEAINRVLQYTGFDKPDGFSRSKDVTAELKRLQDINIPFIADKVLGSEIWHVLFKHVPVGQQATKPTDRDFEVLLDKLSGKLLMYDKRGDWQFRIYGYSRKRVGPQLSLKHIVTLSSPYEKV